MNDRFELYGPGPPTSPPMPGLQFGIIVHLRALSAHVHSKSRLATCWDDGLPVTRSQAKAPPGVMRARSPEARPLHEWRGGASKSEHEDGELRVPARDPRDQSRDPPEVPPKRPAKGSAREAARGLQGGLLGDPEVPPAVSQGVRWGSARGS